MVLLIILRSVVLVFSIVISLLMTVHMFVTAGKAAARLDQGSVTDTGIFPKRSRNVNAWYLVNPDAASKDAYPQLNAAGKPARIGIPQTTACPIFRQQDSGSTNPVLIG